ncbi:GNAT family N-acetyltransferase [Bacillus sp. BGMRC 2118]|nr:GNAT family N-acetyltransferase [Bacillus sp. BGMRC 2118]
MQIRVATLDDVEELAGLMGELGYPTTSEQMEHRLMNIQSNTSYHTLIAELDGEVVGMAGLCKGFFFEHDGINVRIVAFVVNASHRRKGIGERLISESEQWAKEQGAVAMGLTSGNLTERMAAHQFYTNMGFEGNSIGFSKKLV